MNEVEKIDINDIGQWLSSLGLSQYEETFKSNGINFSQVDSLTNEDLSSIGIDALGHRKIIMDGINDLNQIKDNEIANVLKEGSNKFIKRYFITTGIVTLLGFLDSADMAGMFLMCLVLLFVYMVPSIVAFRKGHKYKWAILPLNIFLGYTIIGWGALLLWANKVISGTAAAAAVAAAAAADKYQNKQG